MRTFLAIIGGLTLTVIIGLAVLAGVSTHTAQQRLAEAPAFADETIVVFAQDWDTDTLIARGAPELKVLFEANPRALEQLRNALRRDFGALEQRQPAICPGYDMRFEFGEGHSFYTQCLAEAQLEKAAARFIVNLVHRDGAWQVRGFFVERLEPRKGPGERLVSIAAAALKNVLTATALDEPAADKATAQGAPTIGLSPQTISIGRNASDSAMRVGLGVGERAQSPDAKIKIEFSWP